MKKISICLLVSGNLGYSLLKYIFSKIDVEIHSVFTDRKSDVIQVFCSDNKINCFVGNPRNNKSESFRNNIKERPDIILSINYLFLIEGDLIAYPKSYAVNVHGSLLPKYRGRTPHVWAIINNEKETGITAHLISSECDKGDIIAQKVIPITKEDTGGSILEKYKEYYPLLIDDVISKIQSGNFEIKRQDESKATYYPKRTPDDGEK
jgi:methionyl-tRNA formyltransferase